MVARKENEPMRTKNPTKVERKSDRELVVSRTFDAPARIVFEAWTKPELFKRWWVPKSTGMALLPARWMFAPAARTVWCSATAPRDRWRSIGNYLEVVPHSHLVWTNEESADGSVTTLTFEEKDGKTLLVMHERYPSKEALEADGRRRGRHVRVVRSTGRASRRTGLLTKYLRPTLTKNASFRPSRRLFMVQRGTR